MEKANHDPMKRWDEMMSGDICNKAFIKYS